ncbi:permease [Acinetobacter bereziniae]|uniref:permease n=1 Tax=Acinetobacter bereziniae TaxID=106648 RepID=UPI001116F960|nr:permease [Acinetobacter bereziniae]MBJ8452664.1 permease [Acinetobacter bereziniae]MBJ8456854.1 permease [Acinetobacter bereziniae]TNL53025.1 permease [Acinetobacter bereziniae]TNL62724.1 permease [Acinetobacter bereziniae]
MALLFPVLSFICGLILANSKFSMNLKTMMSLLLARVFIPIVIIYNMVFYKSGSIALILFAFFSCFILFFVYLKRSKDRLASLCFSYTNMAWLGFPIALAIFGAEHSMAMIPLYIGVSIFGNSWAVTSVSSAPQSKVLLFKKVLQSPPVIALIIAGLLRCFDVQHFQTQQWVDWIYNASKWSMSFTGMCVLGMWLRKTKVHVDDLLISTRLAILKLFCGMILCSLAYFFLPVPQIHDYIGVMFLLFCLPPAANIVALETHYQGTGISAKYIASGTIVSCVICVLYGVLIHFLSF